MNSTHHYVTVRPLLRCKRATPTADELEVENQPPCSTKNDHQRANYPAKRQRYDLTRILIPRVEQSVEAHTDSSSWTPPKLMIPTLAEVATSNKHSMGWFVTLPIELLHAIFRLLELRSLSLVALTSKNMSAAALSYLQSARGLSHVMPIVSAGHRTSVDPMEFSGVGKYACDIYLL